MIIPGPTAPQEGQRLARISKASAVAAALERDAKSLERLAEDAGGDAKSAQASAAEQQAVVEAMGALDEAVRALGRAMGRKRKAEGVLRGAEAARKELVGRAKAATVGKQPLLPCLDLCFAEAGWGDVGLAREPEVGWERALNH